MIAGEWIRTALPRSWKVARLRDQAKVVNGYPFDSELFTSDTGLPLVRIRDIASADTEVRYAGDPVPEALLKGGEILVGMDGDFNVARWQGGEALLNQRVCCVRPGPTIDGRFLCYVLPAPLSLINEFTYSTTVKHLSSFDVLKIHLPFPPLAQQRAIADYLDRETARLDALVAAKERVLGLLAEKRRALITRAVTRGLDPRAPLRDSGIPWLGEIPAHWQSMRLRFLVRHLEQGWSPEAENREPGEDEWGVLKLNAVSRGRFDQSAAKALPPDFAIRADLEVHRGDFLVTRSNTPSLVGDACFVEEARPRLMLCDLIYRLTLREDVIDGKFLGHFLTLPEGRGQIESDARGTSGSMVKISREHIKDWWIPLPPLEEQVELVARICRETGALDGMFSATELTIDLLKERRAALIAAAVTGQSDVESAA